ncbi:MAG: SOS response-associated peptidase family protein [Thermoplasmatota archaeon]
MHPGPPGSRICSAVEALIHSMYGQPADVRARAHRKTLGILRPGDTHLTEFGELPWGSKEFPGSFNARIERLDTSPLWSQMEHGTMAIAGYFEPRGKNRPREAWYVPGPVTVKIVANEDFFSIVTQPPWTQLEHVHNRMPAIIGHPELTPREVGPAVWKNKPREICVHPRRSYIDDDQAQLF